MSEALAVREPGTLQVSPEALISKAIESGVSVEALEKLLGMRERLKAEQAREAFIDAMGSFQSQCPTIPKTKVAGAGNYSYRYAPLEAIVAATSELRAKHGFSYRFDTRFEDSPPAQVVICIVSHREGHAEASEFRSPIDGGARMNVMQQSASALTYAKRYAFINAFGIVTGDEDNDAQTAATPRQSDRGPSHPPAQSHAESPQPSAAAPAPTGKNLRVIKAKPKDEAPIAEPEPAPQPLDDAKQRERAFQAAKEFRQRQAKQREVTLSERELADKAMELLERLANDGYDSRFDDLRTIDVAHLAGNLETKLAEVGA